MTEWAKPFTRRDRGDTWEAGIIAARSQKLLLLLKHYGINRSEPFAFLHLSWHLAMDHVEGFRDSLTPRRLVAMPEKRVRAKIAKRRAAKRKNRNTL